MMQKPLVVNRNLIAQQVINRNRLDKIIEEVNENPTISIYFQFNLMSLKASVQNFYLLE